MKNATEATGNLQFVICADQRLSGGFVLLSQSQDDEIQSLLETARRRQSNLKCVIFLYVAGNWELRTFLSRVSNVGVVFQSSRVECKYEI